MVGRGGARRRRRAVLSYARGVRQFLTMRFWMTLVALLAITGLIYVATKSDPRSDQVIAAASTPLVERHIDFVAPVTSVNGDAGFAMQHGVTSARLQVSIDGTRTMVIQPGTPGEITCTKLAEVGQCVVAADLLGDAVLWFSLIPAEPRPSVTLPGIAELRDDNVVELTNGWVLHRATSVDLNCTDDVGSLTEFVRRFGATSTTTFSFDTQQVVRATCTHSPESTTTTVPVTAPPVPDATIAPGDTPVDGTAPDASASGVG
ncbi:MAG: hypothetical protein JWM12_3857 [Ilumatobacteraceae bacterium]|nr:hypothetical protein [Ilumatobacteraceae bacterium]